MSASRLEQPMTLTMSAMESFSQAWTRMNSRASIIRLSRRRTPTADLRRTRWLTPKRCVLALRSLRDIIRSSSSADSMPAPVQSSSMLVIVTGAWSQMSSSLSTLTRAISSGMEILQWVHAETIRLAMTSLAVKSPQGRGSDSRNFSSSSRSDSGLVVFGGRKVTICLP